MKVTKFQDLFDCETCLNQWSMEIVADGRTWLVKGCTTVEGEHTIGSLRAKNNEEYGAHYSSVLAEEIREFVLGYCDLHWAGIQEPSTNLELALELETRAILWTVLDELGNVFHDKEIEAANTAGDSKDFKATKEYAFARGVEHAVSVVVEQVSDLVANPMMLRLCKDQRADIEKKMDPRNLDLVADLCATNQPSDV